MLIIGGGGSDEGKTGSLSDNHFIFYLTLGVAIVEAVPILGIFLVFTLLVVPASISLLFFTGWKSRIFAGWLIGGVASIAGTVASYRWNLPNGPVIVCFLGIAMITAAIFKTVFPRLDRTPEAEKLERFGSTLNREG